MYLVNFLWSKSSLCLPLYLVKVSDRAIVNFLFYRTWNLVEGRSAFIKNIKQSEYFCLECEYTHISLCLLDGGYL